MPTPIITPYKSMSEFDTGHYDDLIKEEKYSDAADYLEQHIPSNPRNNNVWQTEIQNLRNKAAENIALYNGASEEVKTKMRFADKVFKTNGLDDSPYSKNFIEMSKLIGLGMVATSPTQYIMVDPVNSNPYRNRAISVSHSPNLVPMRSTTVPDPYRSKAEYKNLIQIKFAAPQKYMFTNGITGNKVYNNNNNNINNFLQSKGYTKEALDRQNIKIYEDADGNSTIYIDQSSPIFNKFMYDVMQTQEENIGILQGMFDENIQIARESTAGTTKFVDIDNDYGMIQFKRIIDDALNTKLARKEEVENTPHTYTSTVGPLIDDRMEILNSYYSRGYLTQEQYNERKKFIQDEQKQLLGSINVDEQMYSNFNDQSQPLSELDYEDKQTILNALNDSDLDNVVLQSMVVNGTIGTFVTIKNPTVKPKAKSLSDFRKQKLQEVDAPKPIQVFIPNLFHDKAQAAIMRDTKTRSVMKYDELDRWNSSYKFVDGNILQKVDGVFQMNGQALSKEQILTMMSNDMAIKDVQLGLYQKNVNNKGQLINPDKYAQEALLAAIKISNENYPDVPIVDEEGNSLLTATGFNTEKFMSMKGLANNRLKPSIEDKLHYQVSAKLNEIYSIYAKIMGTYNQTNN